MMLVIPVLALLGGASGVNLMPSLEAIAQPMPAFLTVAPPVEKPRAPFSTGWFVAGLAGGELNGMLVGAALAVRDPGCSRRPGAPVAVVSGVATAALGATLGWFAAKGSGPAKVGVVLNDVLGPLGAFTVGFLTSCPD